MSEPISLPSHLVLLSMFLIEWKSTRSLRPSNQFCGVLLNPRTSEAQFQVLCYLPLRFDVFLNKERPDNI